MNYNDEKKYDSYECEDMRKLSPLHHLHPLRCTLSDCCSEWDELKTEIRQLWMEEMKSGTKLVGRVEARTRQKGIRANRRPGYPWKSSECASKPRGVRGCAGCGRDGRFLSFSDATRVGSVQYKSSPDAHALWSIETLVGACRSNAEVRHAFTRALVT